MPEPALSLADQNVTNADADRADAIATAAGSVEAFDRIYMRHSARVYSLARWMGFPGEAEDLTQEIFLLVWRKAGTWNGSAGFATWLRRLSINVILSHRRSTRSARQSLVETGDEETPIEDLAARVDTPEMRMTIESAIENLPTSMRDVFVLHDVEGFGHGDIATLLDIPFGTSASRLHRARMILQEALRDI